MNTGEKPVFSKNKMLTTIAWKINGKTSYAIEGSVFIAGAAIQWLRDSLKLIKNASEAQPNNGNIKLRTYFEHSYKLRRADGSGHSMPIQVEVIDNGPGVSEDIRDEIFDPFVSGRNNGTGLGLALTSKIISDHNGLISLDSKPGNTVFRISLPFVTKLN